MRSRIGPLTMSTGPTGIVVASRPCMLNSSVHAASTAASTTGRYSGRQPASTALTATFSTVHSTRSGGTTATTSSGARRRALEHAQHPRLGRRHDRQAVGPAPVEHAPRPRPRARPSSTRRLRSADRRTGRPARRPRAGSSVRRCRTRAVLGQAVAEAGRRRSAPPSGRASSPRCARPRAVLRRGAASAPSRSSARDVERSVVDHSDSPVGKVGSSSL